MPAAARSLRCWPLALHQHAVAPLRLFAATSACCDDQHGAVVGAAARSLRKRLGHCCAASSSRSDRARRCPVCVSSLVTRCKRVQGSAIIYGHATLWSVCAKISWEFLHSRVPKHISESFHPAPAALFTQRPGDTSMSRQHAVLLKLSDRATAA